MRLLSSEQAWDQLLSLVRLLDPGVPAQAEALQEATKQLRKAKQWAAAREALQRLGDTAVRVESSARPGSLC